MSSLEDREVELIRVRHQLRAIAYGGLTAGDAGSALARFRDLSQLLGDPALHFEHARWRAHLRQRGHVIPARG